MDKQREQFEAAFRSIFGFDAPEQPAMFSGGSFWMIWQAAIAAAEQAQQADPEPFGYFMALPFGWTDCEKDDDGAVALYERPQAQPVAWDVLMALARDVFAACEKEEGPIYFVDLNAIVDRYPAKPPAVAVPDGYALVPVEPTKAMCEAGDRADADMLTVQLIYRAMIDAAPKP